ncbi:phosphate butyryltransferase [Lentibacillus persicus]|uniref:Phosphate butyryltransferase n=1 Tax=Lentibacillus persicus TaxID=640948 RepID=A0A1I1T8F2_9BACI|nr:phosphate butyryltransferase [Lentibacillus persicus]
MVPIWQDLKEIRQQASAENKSVTAVANAADESVLSAIKIAAEESMCSFLLFDDEIEVRKTAEVLDFDIGNERIKIMHSAGNATEAAVKAVHDSKADILMKGNVTTRNLLKAVLSKEIGLRTSKSLSHVALFEIPNQNRLIFLTDVAMNIAPDLEDKTTIIENAVQVAQGVGWDSPKVAVLGAVESVNPDMQATLDAAVLTQMQKRNQITGCIVDGPLALDNAISEEASRLKGIESEVAGKADILVVPAIEAGNMLYKSFMYLAGANVASVISGARAPIVLTSRADSSEDKLNSLALALVAAKTF